MLGNQISPARALGIHSPCCNMLLQASAFFQDYCMVTKLCRKLGRRLFNVQAGGAGPSSSDQQPDTMQHIAQVRTRPSTNPTVCIGSRNTVASFVALLILAVSSRRVQQQCACWCPCTPLACCSSCPRTLCMSGEDARRITCWAWSTYSCPFRFCLPQRLLCRQVMQCWDR